jgi:hypothetical protein
MIPRPVAPLRTNACRTHTGPWPPRHGRPHLLRVTRKQSFSFPRLTAMLDFGSGSRITLRPVRLLTGDLALAGNQEGVS